MAAAVPGSGGDGGALRIEAGVGDLEGHAARGEVGQFVAALAVGGRGLAGSVDGDDRALEVGLGRGVALRSGACSTRSFGYPCFCVDVELLG